ncbi:elicitin [Phytophthora sojae]|uniref:Elicitin n=2 Tax=Phytophthora sojae TaxID=67593 RepID=G4ZX99_PHYSP|nr:elicitin [Phytophthora sojae]ABB55999.1 putative elicitin protein SOJ3X [Phytophthora sojae]EGZ11816.1 elicitin [Phytophthora sojae]|eukprot:XP_009532149.1 elicitin [Phytophthora sojae]
MNAHTILALAAVTFAGSVTADTCSSTQQKSAYVTLASVLSLSPFQGCATDSGYSLMYSTSLPSNDEYVKMCASTNCQSLIKSIISLNPPDCTMSVPTSGLNVNVHELANGFSSKCSSLSTSSPSVTTAAPTATTATPTATAATPTATAPKSSNSTAGSSTSPTKAPSATTAAPTSARAC